MRMASNTFEIAIRNTILFCIAVSPFILVSIGCINGKVNKAGQTDEHDLLARMSNLFDDGERIKIFQLDPVEVGYMKTVQLGEPGIFYDVETIAVKPPVFAIRNFLTDEECERIKDVAGESLHDSKIVSRRVVNVSEDSHYNNATFAKFDKDGNDGLSFTEAMRALSPETKLNSLPENITRYLFQYFIDNDSDGVISPEEFGSIPSYHEKIHDWIANYERDGIQPRDLAKIRRGQERISKQTWLKGHQYDPGFSITKRAAALTELDPVILFASRELQVVRYNPGGHYHAHYDSNYKPSEPCAHTDYLTKNAKFADKQCRFITIMYYLNDVEEGGETAFPIADNLTYAPGSRARKGDRIIDVYNLADHCHDANLVVSPRKGMAVLWYNHHINEETGWLGPRHKFSLHGGCDVIKGEKWIANTWILIDGDYEKQLKYMKDELLDLNLTDVISQQTKKEEERHTEL